MNSSDDEKIKIEVLAGSNIQTGEGLIRSIVKNPSAHKYVIPRKGRKMGVRRRSGSAETHPDPWRNRIRKKQFSLPYHF